MWNYPHTQKITVKFLFLETIHGDPLYQVPQTAMSENEPDEHQSLPPSPQLLPTLEEVTLPDAVEETTAASTEAPSDLDPELLSALGTSTSDTPDYGAPIHDSLANLWLPLLRKGLPKEEKSNLMKEYLIPSNCKLLQAPKLNAEISAAVSEVVRNRDQKLESFQRGLGAGTAAINQAMNSMLRTDDKVRALKSLSDGCRLLTDLHHAFSCDRKKLITPSLEKSFLHMIQDTERDETLFGSSLADKIKASKAIEKQGLQIRKVANQKTATTSNPQPLVARSTHQGNWTGPPRYPSFRGGRGGQRKPAPTARRSYPTTTTNQMPLKKNFNQPKPRAHTQQ